MLPAEFWCCVDLGSLLVVCQRARETSKLKPGDPHPHVPLFVITGFKEDNIAKHDKLLPVLMLWASEVSHSGLAQVCARECMSVPVCV